MPHILTRHPHSVTPSVESIEVSMEWSERGQLWLRYHVEAVTDALQLSHPASPERTDGLWLSTCFELFVRLPNATSYLEYNFAPSSQWAACRFDAYRAGRADENMLTIPVIALDASESHFAMEVETSLPEDFASAMLEIGLSAVIETRDGAKSYWALAHPPGQPDFHHDACFAAELAAASGA